MVSGRIATLGMNTGTLADDSAAIKAAAEQAAQLAAQQVAQQAAQQAALANGNAQIVPGQADPNNPNAINVVDYASQVAANPSLGINGDDPSTPQNENMSLVDQTKNQTPDIAAGLVANATPMAVQPTVAATTVDTVDPKAAATYTAEQTAAQVAQQDMTAAQGTVSDNALITGDNIAQHDMVGMSTGVNADGSINPTGQALQQFASVNLSNVIDTSTASGKALAEQLGVNGYVDSKATVQGQLDLLQAQFSDENGNPKIPTWAAGTARNVSKIAAFSGMTGTAATAAMATALMESSVSIAQSDATFFQTLTVQNLTNQQQQVINTANVLAKMDEQNVDNRMAAAIQNSKNFLEMDLANLTNEQQSKVINNQNRVNSILEDAKAVNAQRLFTAQSENDTNQFYDQLNTQIKQYNASQTLDADKFNATMSDSREKFYKEMQYNIDIANANWRQTVELQEDTQAFQAATQDVKNMVDISTAQLNQIWDRSDALLDYVWKSSESQKDRDAALAGAKLKAKTSQSNANMTAIGSLAGTFIGSETGQSVIKSVFGGLF